MILVFKVFQLFSFAFIGIIGIGLWVLQPEGANNMALYKALACVAIPNMMLWFYEIVKFGDYYNGRK